VGEAGGELAVFVKVRKVENDLSMLVRMKWLFLSFCDRDLTSGMKPLEVNVSKNKL
jgi:hypothetical protein